MVSPGFEAGDPKSKRRPRADRTDRAATAVRVCDRSDNRKAETDTAAVPRTSAIRPCETVEDAAERLGRNAAAFVLDLDREVCTARTCAKHDPAAFARVLDCVLKQCIEGDS